MFDLTDHQLTTIGTWTEVGILVWMVWEGVGPRLGLGSMATRISALAGHGFWGGIWENRTLVLATIGLVIVAWLHFREVPVPIVTGFTQQQVDEKIAASTAPIKRQLNESNKDLQNTRDIILGLQGELVDMTRQRDALRQVQPHPPGAKSTFLGFDDAERWRLSVALQDALRNSQSICDAHVWGKPSSDTSAAFWKEFQPILGYSGWLLQGGPTPKTVFPDGVTLSVGSDHGGSFDCAYRLSELLEKLTVRPVTLRVNQTTPDLIACKNTCLEIVVGDVAVH